MISHNNFIGFDDVATVGKSFSDAGCVRASSMIDSDGSSSSKSFAKMPVGFACLDRLIGGGFSGGMIVEWGMPWWSRGREFLVAALAHMAASPQGMPWTLWVYSRPDLSIYPPAWAARGVDLERIRFAHAQRPTSDLRPVFLNHFFKILVLDAPGKLGVQDCAFLSGQARRQDQLIFVIQPWFLTQRRGNVWARFRFNCWSDPGTKQLNLQIVRGLPARQMTFALSKGEVHAL